MMKEPHHQENGPKNLGTTIWAEAQIVTDVRYTKPGTPLDELLRKRQTAVLLELLSVEQQTESKPRSSDPS